MEPTNSSDQKALQAIQEKEQIIRLVLHDLRPPLSFFEYLTGTLLQKAKGSPTTDMVGVLEELQMAAVTLVQSSQKIFTWLEIQSTKFSLHKESILLDALFEKVKQHHQADLDERRNQLQVDYSGISIEQDEHALFTILSNLVENANNVVNSGHIKLTASKLDNELHIKITDSGRGMGTTLTDNILAALEGHNAGPTLYRYGYRIILELLRKLDGQLLFGKGEQGGFEVSLIIPA